MGVVWNYHRSAVAKEIFSKLDDIVWNILGGGGKRGHPNKRNTWVANKYGHSEGTRNWVFSTGENRLKPFSDTKIVRCAGLKLDKNLFIECGA